MNIHDIFLFPTTENDGITYGVPTGKLIKTMDMTEESWLNSKPNIKYNSTHELDEEIAKLKTNNLPVVTMQHYGIILYSSVYFRDLLFCLPGIIPWSQSTRNMEYTNPIYQISNEIQSNKEAVERDLKALQWCREESEKCTALDVIKKKMPRSCMMSYSFIIDRRSLLTFVKTLEYLDGHLYDVYGKLLLRLCQISEDEYRNSKVFHIYDKLATEEYHERVVQDKASHVDDIQGLYKLHTVRMDFAIAAQFIRQHFSYRRYYEFNAIKRNGYVNALTRGNGDLTDKTIVSVLSDAQSFNRTISRRVCWFAVFDTVEEDSWAMITDEYVKNLSGEEFLKLPPCKGCSSGCDIKDEFKLRAIKLGDPNLNDQLTPADRNEICPILKDELSPEKSYQDLFKSREEAQGSNSITWNKWKEAFNQ